MLKALVVGAMLLVSSVCSAHSLTDSEMFIAKAGIVKTGIGCTMEETRKAFGLPEEKRFFNVNGMRGVNYVFTYYNVEIMGAVPTAQYKTEKELPVVSFMIKDNRAATASGITVGDAYSKVVNMFGYAPQGSCQEGHTRYDYAVNGKVMYFCVDGDGIIREIGAKVQ